MNYTRNSSAVSNTTNTNTPSKGVIVFEGLDIGFLTVREGMVIKANGATHDLATWLLVEGNVAKLAKALAFRPKVEREMRDFG